MKTTKATVRTPSTMSRSAWTPCGRNRIDGIKPIVTKEAKSDKVHRSQDSLSSVGSNSSKPVRSKSLRTHTSSSLQSSKEEIRRITNKENLTVGRSRLGSRTAPVTPVSSRVSGRNGASALSRPVTAISTPLVLRRRMNSGVARGPASGDAATDDRSAGDAVVAELQKNKRALEHQVSELVRNAESKKAEIAQLKMELNKLKETHCPDEQLMQDQIDSLQDENRVLKERLISFTGSLDRTPALSDTEKELLLLAKCNSAPPSIIGLPQDGNHIRPPLVASKSDGGGSELDLGEASGTLYPSLTADWDKQSSSSLSEMSVACLQDRILQMEETHYSTNEELQATLQELTDLQDQLTELQAENERLAEEKAVLLESLCSQTEKLEDCRSTNDNLRQLLLEQSDSGTSTGSEREVKLLELLKSAQEEKESLVAQLSELRAAVDNAHEDESRTQDELTHLGERVTLLQSIVDGANSDKRLLEKHLAESKEQVADAQIEMNRTKTQLENERIKVLEMQQAREAADKSELDEMLDNARKEKDRAEAEAGILSEQLAVSRCESSRYKESLGILQEEIMVAKNNAKKQISDLEYRLDQLNVEMDSARAERQALQDHIHELECKCQRHLEDKRELRAAISDLKNKVKESEEKSEKAEKELEDRRITYETEMREWKQFQEDLLMTVRVANDFKTEAQHDLERLLLENRQFKDKVSTLQAELDKLKSAAEPTPVSTATQRRVLRPVSNIENPVLCSMEQEMVSLRRTSRSDTRPLSVKSLIESIESAAKQAKAQNGSSRSSSTSSINSAVSEKSPSAVPQIRKSEDIFIKPPLRSSISDTSSIIHDQNSSLSSLGSSQPSSLPDYTSCKSVSSTDRSSMSPSNKVSSDTESNKTIPSPISILSNKLEPMRRNSYSDILDKKDPLVSLVKGGGSKRNALLKWCQNKTVGYKGIDITNFSSSWNDGLALCAVLHTYLPDKIPYDELDNKDKRRNFTLAFKAAESVGIPCNLNISDMISIERPDWQAVMAYVTCIYKHFET